MKFLIDEREIDVNLDVLDMLVKINKFGGIEGVGEKIERNLLDMLRRFFLLNFGFCYIRSDESWDFLMEGGCRDLFELFIIEDEMIEMDVII